MYKLTGQIFFFKKKHIHIMHLETVPICNSSTVIYMD